MEWTWTGSGPELDKNLLHGIPFSSSYIIILMQQRYGQQIATKIPSLDKINKINILCQIKKKLQHSINTILCSLSTLYLSTAVPRRKMIVPVYFAIICFYFIGLSKSDPVRWLF